MVDAWRRNQSWAKDPPLPYYLPASSDQVHAPKAEQVEFIHGKGKILVMDDEESVRASAREVLIYLGYEVALAKDGGEAIRAYQEAQEAGQPFAAAILDLTVRGGMGGQETMQRLMQFNPQVRQSSPPGIPKDERSRIIESTDSLAFCPSHIASRDLVRYMILEEVLESE